MSIKELGQEIARHIELDSDITVMFNGNMYPLLDVDFSDDNIELICRP